jgi:C4-dicarboxylate-specific signal transduction histidine kinase
MQDSGKIWIKARPKRDTCVLRFVTQVGIDPKIMPRMFDAFVTTKPRGMAHRSPEKRQRFSRCARQ